MEKHYILTNFQQRALSPLFVGYTYYWAQGKNVGSSLFAQKQYIQLLVQTAEFLKNLGMCFDLGHLFTYTVKQLEAVRALSLFDCKSH